MTPMDLAMACRDVIEAGRTKVLLVVPGPQPRGERVRLDRTSRKRCPMGEIASWLDNPPRTVAYFDAIDVLAWLSAQGLVDVDARSASEPAASPAAGDARGESGEGA